MKTRGMREQSMKNWALEYINNGSGRMGEWSIKNGRMGYEEWENGV